MSRRRRLLFNENDLPALLYERVPFSYCNGDCYFATDYIPHCTDVITCGVVITAGSYNTMFGCMSADGNGFGVMTILNNLASRYKIVKRSAWTVGNEYHDYVFRNGTIYADGDLAAESPTDEAFETDRTLYIAAFNNGDSVTFPLTGELYYLKAYNAKGELLRSYIPCIRKSDGKEGLFDTVYQQFLPKISI